jgi:predicted amino acid dehydrogenase
VDSFAFIIHPIDPKRDVSRKYPLLGRMLSKELISFFSTFFPPVYLSEIEGIRSEATQKAVRGWLIACPLTPERMISLPEKTAYRKIIQAGRVAEKLGANLLGLGAFTSVIGDGGVTVADSLRIPVTTGDAYTVAVAVQALEEAGALMDIELANACAAVVGATGAIGQVCAELLAERVAELTLIGRRQTALEELRQQLRASRAKAAIHIATDTGALRNSQLVLAVSSAIETVIGPGDLRPGSVICDVARPRDVSANVAETRKDVLVIDGGIVDVPGKARFNFDFGLPEGKTYACMAETIALALEGRFESYSLGKHITRQQVEEIDTIAKKHGFRLSGFRSFEQEISVEHIRQIKERATPDVPRG